jgi:FK506-binding protein 2
MWLLISSVVGIIGLDMGVEGMCVGEVRRILIPHNLGYGELGAPGLIAPNTDLMYEVELIKSMTTFS